MFYVRCPCCNSKLNKFLFFTKIGSACKYKTDHMCNYCPKCKKQISKGQHVKQMYVLIGIILAFSWMLSKATISFFQILPSFPDMAKILPVMLPYALMLFYLSLSFISLECCKEEDDDSLEKADVSNKSFDGLCEFGDDVRITPFEQKMQRHLVLSPIYYGAVVIVGVLLLIWFD